MVGYYFHEESTWKSDFHLADEVFSLLVCMKQITYGEALIATNEIWLQDKSQWETDVRSTVTCKSLNPANSPMN